MLFPAELLQSGDDDDEPAHTLRWAGHGLVGGLLATVVMTLYRAPVAASLPPTAAFWARFVAGGDPEDHPRPALLLHLGYGAGGGALFGLLFRATGADERSALPREATGVSLGTLYGAVLSVVGSRVVLRRLLAMDLDIVEAVVFHAGHLVYGLTLGTWVGTREIIRDIDFESADDRPEGSDSPRR